MFFDFTPAAHFIFNFVWVGLSEVSGVFGPVGTALKAILALVDNADSAINTHTVWKASIALFAIRQSVAM